MRQLPSMRIGLLGGAFDPPHNAHLEIARRVRDAYSLDRVDLLVSGESPHAQGKTVAAEARHRVSMAQLAVTNQPGLGVDDRETRRTGKSFTVDTLRELRGEKPGDEIFFIIGGDMLASLPTWREASLLLSLAHFVPVMRPGFMADVYDKLRPALGDEAVNQLQRNAVSMPLMTTSSSEIRAAIAAGESISHWVPPVVEAYIRANRLYLGES